MIYRIIARFIIEKIKYYYRISVILYKKIKIDLMRKEIEKDVKKIDEDVVNFNDSYSKYVDERGEE